MYIHNKIQKAALELMDEYDLELIELLGEMNHASWELSVLNKDGINDIKVALNCKPETENCKPGVKS